MIDKTFIKNKTAQNTLILYGSIIFSILLGWVVTKLNTHFLTVEEYGQYAFFISVLLYTRSYFSFGTFESASRLVALEKNESARREYFGAILISAFVFVIPFTLFYLIFSGFSDSIFEVKIGRLCNQFAAFAGLAILQSMLLSILRGSGRIKELSLLNFSPRLFYLAFIGFLLINNSFDLSGTIYSFLLGLLITIVIILVIIKPRFLGIKHKLKNLIAENKRYGIHLYFGNIMHETLFHADKFLVSFFLSSESMAYYGLAYMLTYPLSHFSNSLSTTLFNKFASQQQINKKIFQINYLYITVTVLIFIVLREPIIRYLFTEKYLPAVSVMFPLALAFGFSGLSKPYSLFLMARGQGKTVRNISTIIPLFNISLNLLLVPGFGINGAAWSAFAAYGLDLVLYIYYYYRLINSEK